MDIMLVAGLEGAFEVTFNMLVPEGNTGYYNVQENQSPGVAWAFECILNGNGTVNYNIDGGTYTLDGTFTPGTWLKITHLIDTDSDLMHIYFDDVYLGQLPFDGPVIGGVNFYAAGDGINTPTYYIDDVLVDVTDPVVDDVQIVDALECNFGPNPAQDFIRVQANIDNATVRVFGLDGKVVLEERRNDLINGAQLNGSPEWNVPPRGDERHAPHDQAFGRETITKTFSSFKVGQPKVDPLFCCQEF